MVASFVRTETRADLRSALESCASDAQLEALLPGWELSPKGDRAARIAQTEVALHEVERGGCG